MAEHGFTLPQLDEDTTPGLDSLIYGVDDPAGTPTDVGMSLANTFGAVLSAIRGLTSAANKIIRFTGSGTADLLDFLDEDNMASDSATALASQQSIKAYVDAAGGGGTSDHGALDGLAEDDHTQYALADGSRGDFATEAQGALADSALQDSDDVVGAFTGTPDGSLFLRDDGTLATPPGGGGASSVMEEASVFTQEGTASTSFTDLTTAGPAVTVDIPASGKAVVTLTSLIVHSLSTGTRGGTVGFTASGANTLAADDFRALFVRNNDAALILSAVIPLSGLTPGSTTFTCKYLENSGSGTATFSRRRICVVTYP